jgi:hypothetical protein
MIEYRPDCHLAQISLEKVRVSMFCTWKLKRARHTQGLSKNALLQASVNYRPLCSLHFVMLINQ